MAKKNKQKSASEIEQDEVTAAYTATLKGVAVDLSDWSGSKIKMALKAIANHPVRTPSPTTKTFYTDLFARLPANLKNEGPLNLSDAVKIKNTTLLEEMLHHWDPLARKCAALTNAVQQGNLRAVQMLLPVSDIPSVAVYCIQVCARIGNKRLFDIFEPYIDWALDDCYTARFCALRCADTILEEERRSQEKGVKSDFEKTRLPNQYDMLVQVIRKNDHKELERRLHALSVSRVGGTVVERGEKGLEIFYRAYEESVLKERLLAVVKDQEIAPRRVSKI